MKMPGNKAVTTGLALLLTAAAITTSAWARDRIPPSMPGEFSAQPFNHHDIKLDWTASTDNFGIERYHLMRDGMVLTRTDQLSYVDSGLVAGSSYTYDLMADDGENYSYVTSIIVTIPVGSSVATNTH